MIGGGYATGRELASFFLPSGPWGGLYGMLLATMIWSTVCVVTFLFALRTGSLDYRTFFRNLLGRFWPVFEAAYIAALIVILATFAAAAGRHRQRGVRVPAAGGRAVVDGHDRAGGGARQRGGGAAVQVRLVPALAGPMRLS